MSNGDSSKNLTPKCSYCFKQMIPNAVLKSIRGVVIDYSYQTFYDYILGFTFIDRDGTPIW